MNVRQLYFGVSLPKVLLANRTFFRENNNEFIFFMTSKQIVLNRIVWTDYVTNSFIDIQSMLVME